LGSKEHAMRVMKGKDLILARTKHNDPVKLII
jgi:hypothetical protein